MGDIFDFFSDHFAASGFIVMAMIAIIAVTIRNRSLRRARHKLKKLEESAAEPLSLHPLIDPSRCVGTGACVKACPEGEIIQIVQHQAALVSPTKCVGHGECEASCPMSAISLVFGSKRRGVDIPRISTHYESNISGLYIAGELGGMGLIRNAVKQGALAARHALDRAKRLSSKADYDLAIVGAGPAGLSAALAATEAKQSYIVLEQNSFGGTVFNYPRQKIVMNKPAKLPLAGDMKFPKNKVSKEQLLQFWQELRQRFQLNIREKVQFQGLEILSEGMDDNLFRVKTSDGRFTAKRVLLATGVRGSPRKLGLKNEDLPKVSYALVEPDQYRGNKIAIVGAGNSAAEAAASLAEPSLQNRVTLVVRGGALERCNDENRQQLERLEKQGRLSILFNARVNEISPNEISVLSQEKTSRIANDFLFVLIGADRPQEFLKGLGIEIDRKFGVGLSNSRSPH